jgi:hypothetical protein
MIRKLENQIRFLRELHNEGYELRSPMDDDWAFLKKPEDSDTEEEEDDDEEEEEEEEEEAEEAAEEAEENDANKITGNANQ